MGISRTTGRGMGEDTRPGTVGMEAMAVMADTAAGTLPTAMAAARTVSLGVSLDECASHNIVALDYCAVL